MKYHHIILNGLFNRLDIKEFNTCFVNWINSIVVHSEDRIIAFDGKTIRGNASNLSDSKIHIVPAFCARHEISLGQIKVNEKSNEITAITDLLELIAVFTKILFL